MRTARSVLFTGLCTGLLVLGADAQAQSKRSAPARPGDAVAECIAATEAVQEALNGGRLRAARAQVDVCLAEQCPAFLRKDCDDFGRRIEQAMPSIVVRVTSDSGADLTDATLVLDDASVPNDGRIVELDPGKHRLVVSAPGFSARTETILATAGEKNRAVVVRLARAYTAKVEAAPPQSSAMPATGTWIATASLGAVALAGLSVFAGAGLSATGQRRELSERCAPSCGEAEIDAVRSKYVVAAAAFTTGVVTLAGAGLMYLFGPRAAATAAAPPAGAHWRLRRELAGAPAH